MKKIQAAAAAIMLSAILVSCGETRAASLERFPQQTVTFLSENSAAQDTGNESSSRSDSDGGAPSDTEATDNMSEQLAKLFSGFDTALDVSSDFFEWCAENADDPELNDKLYNELSSGGYSDEKWYELTGMTVKAANALYSLHSGKADKDDNIYAMPSNGEENIQLTFGGDISLADNWHAMQYYETTENGISDCISPFLIDKMNSADIAMLNNEFCFSENGEPLPGKAFTFRGKPSNASIYHELGIDIVDLANNHCYDFGKQAFLDTLDTLRSADIAYMGAGRDIDEASKPVYFIIEGRKIAYVAATRAEFTRYTPEATDSEPGVLLCYDPAAFTEVIKEAKRNADIVIANVHWGIENCHWLEDYQRTNAYQYVDAGADLIVGSHAHCLQGIEYYKGVPIVYNLGNFWFSNFDIDTGLLGVTVNSDNTMELVFYPATQRYSRTTYVGGEAEGERILALLRSCCYGLNATIDENGVITEKN